MTYITLAIILCGLLGIWIFIAYHKWEGFIKHMVNSVKAAGDEVVEIEEPAQDKTLMGSGNIVYVVLAVLFPVMYLLIKAVFTWGDLNDGNAVITVFAMLMFVLVSLVLGVLGLDAKNPKTKFLLELVPTIGLEIMVAFSLFYLFNRDGLSAARAIKSIGMMLIVGIPFFLKYARKTKENWLRMKDFAQTSDKA